MADADHNDIGAQQRAGVVNQKAQAVAGPDQLGGDQGHPADRICRPVVIVGRVVESFVPLYVGN